MTTRTGRGVIAVIAVIAVIGGYKRRPDRSRAVAGPDEQAIGDRVRLHEVDHDDREWIPPVKRDPPSAVQRRVVDVEHTFGTRVVHSVGAESRRPQVRS
jgi:hypothetical protein